MKNAALIAEMIRLSGHEPSKNIETGLLPGEKLYEELLIAGEGIKPTRHEKIRVVNAMPCDWESIAAQCAALYLAAREIDDPASSSCCAPSSPNTPPLTTVTLRL